MTAPAGADDVDIVERGYSTKRLPNGGESDRWGHPAFHRHVTVTPLTNSLGDNGRMLIACVVRLGCQF